MATVQAWHLDDARIEDGLDHVRAAPRDVGRVEMIVRRPGPGERETPDRATFTTTDGLVGDDWIRRGSRHTEDGGPHPDMQVAVTGARFLDLISDGDRNRWALAGDQLVVDLDLSDEARTAGERLRIGTALFEVTPAPHNGCAHYTERFGKAAIRAAASPEGRRLHLRGIYLKVVEAGEVAVGDTITVVG